MDFFSSHCVGPRHEGDCRFFVSTWVITLAIRKVDTQRTISFRRLAAGTLVNALGRWSSSIPSGRKLEAALLGFGSSTGSHHDLHPSHRPLRRDAVSSDWP